MLISLHKRPHSTALNNIPSEESHGSTETIWHIACAHSPDEEFKVISHTFVAPRDGTFLVQLDDVTTQIQVAG
jgi:hypothetical protein